MTEFPTRLRFEPMQTIPALALSFCVLFAFPLLAADTPPASSVQDIIKEDRDNDPESPLADETKTSGEYDGESAAPGAGDSIALPRTLENGENDSAKVAPPSLSLGESGEDESANTTNTSTITNEKDPSDLAAENAEKATSASLPLGEAGSNPVAGAGNASTGNAEVDTLPGVQADPENSPAATENTENTAESTEPGTDDSAVSAPDPREITQENRETESPSLEGNTREGESSQELEISTQLGSGQEGSAETKAKAVGGAALEGTAAVESNTANDGKVVDGKEVDGTAGVEGARVGEEKPDQPAAISANADPFVGVPDEELFPTSPGILEQKEFWIQIFTHYNSHQGVLHDKRVALPVYESLDLTGLRSRRAQSRYVKKAKRLLAARLQALARALDEDELLSGDQEDLLAKLPINATLDEIREFAANIRFQRGLADRFPEGLIRSGAILEQMRAILIRNGVPGDIVYLPHVESTFNNKTRSKYGAVGIWQFTRGTGKLFLNIQYELDERLDPIMASEAAAKFLRQNYKKLGNWPLAITAYNHGPQSLKKISNQLKTTDLGVLIEHYQGRLFKFASKNFYAEFLAAREVARNYRKYFGDLELAPPLEFSEAALPYYVTAKSVAKKLGITLKTLKDLNPALRYPVWSGSKFIPKRYALRIPKKFDPARFIASIPKSQRMKRQKRAATVRVVPGDSLFRIGQRLGIPWRKIAAANNLTGRSKLYPGQRLVIPWSGKLSPSAIIKAARIASANNRKPKAVTKTTTNTSAKSTAAARPSSGSVLTARIGNPPNDPSGFAKAAALSNRALSNRAQSNRKVQASRFQELAIVNYNSKHKYGEVISAYGESLGKYADWAEVSLSDLRGLNQMSTRARLYPGRTISIPLHVVSKDTFGERRRGFHSEREATFLAEYDITSMRKVKVRPGQSPWNIAQTNNVPMWLFYRENPALIDKTMLPGMNVILPVLRAGGPVADRNNPR